MNIWHSSTILITVLMIVLATCICNYSGVKFHQLCIFINISPLNLWITMTTCYPLHPCQCLIPSASPNGWYFGFPAPLNLKVYTEKGLFSKHCWLNITYMYTCICTTDTLHCPWYFILRKTLLIQKYIYFSLSRLLNVAQMHIALAPKWCQWS